MPCYSSFTTSMISQATLQDAIAKMGGKITVRGTTVIAEFANETLTYTKGYSGAYKVDADSEKHRAVAKKYAEMTVSAWAKSKGFSVNKSPTNPNKIELRRG